MATWQSKTLGELFPSTLSAADAIASSANAALSKFNSVLSQLNSKADALNQLSGENDNLLSALQASGFYVLELAPGAGGALPRIQSSGGDTPPVDGLLSRLSDCGFDC